MKIGGSNKKPKIAEENSFSSSDSGPKNHSPILIPSKSTHAIINNNITNNNKSKNIYVNNPNKDLSSELLFPNKSSSLFPRPGTSINTQLKANLAGNKILSSNNISPLNKNNNTSILKNFSKMDQASTTINSDRFNVITENFKNLQKKLDNSYEDYWFYEIVDDESFLKFKSFVKEYISRRLFDKTNKLYVNLRKQISETIVHDLNNIRSYSDTIEKITNQHCNKKAENKSCFESLCSCCCKSCKKKKKKNKLISYYDLKTHAYRLTNSFSDLAQEIKESFNEKSLEEISPNPTEEMKSFCDEKAEKYLEKPAIDERLREEVEYYSKYFKIENIIEKQKNTLQQQEDKKLKIKGIRELNNCIVCMENQRSVMFSPCRHLICCEKCANNAVKEDKCLICNKPIIEKIDINS